MVVRNVGVDGDAWVWAMQIVADIAKHDAFVEAQRVAREERSKEEVKATAARVKAYYERLAEVQQAADDAMKERVALWNEIGRQRDAQVAAAQATRDAELATMRAAEKVRHPPEPAAERAPAAAQLETTTLSLEMALVGTQHPPIMLMTVVTGADKYPCRITENTRHTDHTSSPSIERVRVSDHARLMLAPYVGGLQERMAKEAAVVYSETEFATTLRGFASEVDSIRKGHAERRKEEIKAAKQQSREAVRGSTHRPPPTALV